jgi:hypothetical protein
MHRLSSFKTNFVAFVVSVIICLSCSANIFAQGQTKWIRVGELHNWFSELGCNGQPNIR